MVAVILLILAFALASVAGVFLLQDAGYVLINVGGTVVETSAVVLVLGVILAVVLGHIAWRAVRGTVQAPGNVKRAIERRKRDKARESFLAGIGKLYEARLKEAEVDLVRRAAHHDHAYLNYLAAAEAADGVSAADRRDHYLQLAIDANPGHEVPVLLKQADLQLAGRRHAEALATLLRLKELEPHHPGVQRRLADVYEVTGEWEALRELLPQLESAGVIAPDRWNALMQRCCVEMLRAAGKHNALDSLKAAWEAIPRPFRSRHAVVREYATLLARAGADAEAIAKVEAAMKQDWDAELCLLFGDLKAADPISQLATVEQWIKRYEEKPELLFVAGRLCLRNRLWGRARSYLEASLAKRSSPDVYFALARLNEETQEPGKAMEFYRRGLELALATDSPLPEAGAPA